MFQIVDKIVIIEVCLFFYKVQHTQLYLVYKWL